MTAKRYTLSLFSTSPNPAHNKKVERVISVSWEELPDILCANNWSPAVYAEGTRNLTNYKGHPHLFAFDIDGGMSIEEAKLAFKDYKCLIQTSRNHQKVKNAGTASEKAACDRYRVVFELSHPIETDEDFKATWEAYSDLYPLDPQTRSSSMYFFKSTLTVFDNPLGIPLAVIDAKAWSEAKGSTYSFTKGAEGATRGKISAMSEEFLAKGAPAGMFNVRLFKCAVDHLEQRYYQEEFLAICTRAASSGAFDPLDTHDLATVASAYNREPKYGIRQAGTSGVEAQKRDIVNRIMDGEFVQCVLSEDTIWYKIVDYENKEVEIVQNIQILKRHIEEELQKPENHYTSTKKTGEANAIANVTKKMEVDDVLKRWMLAGDAITEMPKPILWRGVEGWCHKRFEADFTPGQPHPAWDEFTGRVSDPEVFKAWVFSCFVPEHETRQALWLLGKNGEDGKTRVAETIASFFGPAAGVVSGPQLNPNNRFALMQFVGKRLALYPDCKHTNFPKTELFRNLTGSDLVAVEFKGAGFIQQKLSIKVLIASNYEPETSGANYDTSRLIVLDVTPSLTRDDPTWSQRLKDEMPAFLGDAQRAFSKLCPMGGKIQMTNTLTERVQDCAEENGLEDESLFSEMFKIDPASPSNQWVRGIDVMNVLLRKNIYNPSDRARQFRVYLETRYGVKKIRGTTGFRYYHVVFKDEGTREAYQSDVV